MMSDLQKAIGDYETPKYDQDIQSLETESINLVDKEVDKILYGIRQRVKPEVSLLQSITLSRIKSIK